MQTSKIKEFTNRKFGLMILNNFKDKIINELLKEVNDKDLMISIDFFPKSFSIKNNKRIAYLKDNDFVGDIKKAVFVNADYILVRTDCDGFNNDLVTMAVETGHKVVLLDNNKKYDVTELNKLQINGRSVITHID